MRTQIFISYRRSDTREEAKIIQTRLEAHQWIVFRDVSHIEIAQNFPIKIKQALDESEFVLVLIGKEWLDVRDSKGNRRLDDPHDFVHREIRYALLNHNDEYSLGRVIPVIVQNARMPKPRELHPDLRDLVALNGFVISPESFNEDVLALSKMIKTLWPSEQAADMMLDRIDEELGGSEMVFTPKPSCADNPEIHDLPEVATWQCNISSGMEMLFETKESGAFEGQLTKPRNVKVEGFYKFHFGPKYVFCMNLKGYTFDGESFNFDIPIEQRAGEQSYSGSNDRGEYFRLEWFNRSWRTGGRFGL